MSLLLQETSKVIQMGNVNILPLLGSVKVFISLTKKAIFMEQHQQAYPIYPSSTVYTAVVQGHTYRQKLSSEVSLDHC